MTYQSIELVDLRPVMIRLDADERTAWLEPDTIRCFDVDWATRNGRITLMTEVGTFVVDFPDDDMGQACSDAIDAILGARTARLNGDVR